MMRERLGEREAQDGDRLQAALRLGLAGDTVDVRGEDQADTDTGADRREAVADHVRALPFHGVSFRWFLSRVCTRGVRACGLAQCSSARAPEMYMALSRVKT